MKAKVKATGDEIEVQLTKLNSIYAIEEYTDEEGNTYQRHELELIPESDLFKAGIQWLLSQPLEERLTEEEKEKARKLYSESKEFEAFYIKENIFKDSRKDISYYQGRRDALTLFFGADFITNKSK